MHLNITSMLLTIFLCVFFLFVLVANLHKRISFASPFMCALNYVKVFFCFYFFFIFESFFVAACINLFLLFSSSSSSEWFPHSLHLYAPIHITSIDDHFDWIWLAFVSLHLHLFNRFCRRWLVQGVPKENKNNNIVYCNISIKRAPIQEEYFYLLLSMLSRVIKSACRLIQKIVIHIQPF